MGHKDRAVELWKKFIEKSRNQQNLMMVSGLLEKSIWVKKKFFQIQHGWKALHGMKKGSVHRRKWLYF